MGNPVYPLNVWRLLGVIQAFVDQYPENGDVKDSIASLQSKFEIETELNVIKRFVEKRNNPDSNEDALESIEVLRCLHISTCTDVHAECRRGGLTPIPQ